SVPEAIQAVRKAVIQAKLDLSEREDTEIVVDELGPATGSDHAAGAPAYRSLLTRAVFESIITPVIDRTLDPCRQALADAGLRPSQTDEINLVVGAWGIPLLRRLLAGL